MTGRIVVGIDGSEQSAAALEWAVARARLAGEALELVQTYSVLPSLSFYSYQGAMGQEPVDWLVETSRHLLDAAAQRVRELAPEVACTLISRMGHPAPVLVAASEGARAVVVGRRGLGSAASAVLGSVSNRLAVEAHCPVVVVGEDPPTSGPVVVGVDGSEFGSRALRFAVAEAALRHTSVRAVAAYEAPHRALQADPELVARMRAGVAEEAAETIARSQDDARVAGVDVQVEAVAVEGPAAQAILEHAADAQLIVVGSHGKGLVRRILLGSVSRQVLNDADRPVAVVDLPQE